MSQRKNCKSCHSDQLSPTINGLRGMIWGTKPSRRCARGELPSFPPGSELAGRQWSTVMSPSSTSDALSELSPIIVKLCFSRAGLGSVVLTAGKRSRFYFRNLYRRLQGTPRLFILDGFGEALLGAGNCSSVFPQCKISIRRTHAAFQHRADGRFQR